MALQAPPTVEREVSEILSSVKALQKGHFELASGRHSDKYVEKFNLFSDPQKFKRVCEFMADSIRELRVSPTVIAGPATGGMMIALEVASRLGLPAIYLEKDRHDKGEFLIKRGRQVSPDDRIVVVDDILTTGRSVAAPMRHLQSVSANVLAIVVMVDRSNGNVKLGVPLRSLVRLDIPTWEVPECPQCKLGRSFVPHGMPKHPKIPDASDSN